MKVICRGAEESKVYTFWHVDFKNQEFYAAAKYAHVTEEGPTESLFTIVKQQDETPLVPTTQVEDEVVALRLLEAAGGGDENLPQEVCHNMPLLPTDMDNLCKQGITIDDDNDPSPKNIPQGRTNKQALAADGLVWKGEGIICPRRSSNLMNLFALIKISHKKRYQS